MKRTKSASYKVRKYLEAHPDASVETIAAATKASKATVYNVRHRAHTAAKKMVSEAGARIAQRARATQVGGTHYKDMGVEPWDVVDTWPKEQRIGYYRGNAVKYLMRLGAKGAAAEDAAKAEHYFRKLMEVMG